MYSVRPTHSVSYTKTQSRPRVPSLAPPCSYQNARYLDTRIQTIIQRYNREIPTDKMKKQLVIDMLSIVTDTDVTNEQIQTCIKYLNDMDAWSSTYNTTEPKKIGIAMSLHPRILWIRVYKP